MFFFKLAFFIKFLVIILKFLYQGVSMWDLLILGGVGYIAYKVTDKKTKQKINACLKITKDKTSTFANKIFDKGIFNSAKNYKKQSQSDSILLIEHK